MFHPSHPFLYFLRRSSLLKKVLLTLFRLKNMEVKNRCIQLKCQQIYRLGANNPILHMTPSVYERFLDVIYQETIHHITHTKYSFL